jgi:hypothetical protein
MRVPISDPKCFFHGRLGVVEARSFDDFAFGVQYAIAAGLVAQLDPDGLCAVGLCSRFLHRLRFVTLLHKAGLLSRHLIECVPG